MTCPFQGKCQYISDRSAFPGPRTPSALDTAILSPRSTENRAAAVETRRRPKRRRIVIGLEGGRALGQGDPGQLGAGIDVDVGRQRRRTVERADADEAKHLAPAVVAP